jgi:hypothetical protein
MLRTATKLIMIRLVEKELKNYPESTLDGIWACFYNNLRSILEHEGGNQYKQAHNGGQNRAQITGSKIDLKVDSELARRVKDKFWAQRRPVSYYFPY